MQNFISCNKIVSSSHFDQTKTVNNSDVILIPCRFCFRWVAWLIHWLLISSPHGRVSPIASSVHDVSYAPSSIRFAQQDVSRLPQRLNSDLCARTTSRLIDGRAFISCFNVVQRNGGAAPPPFSTMINFRRRVSSALRLSASTCLNSTPNSKRNKLNGIRRPAPNEKKYI